MIVSCSIVIMHDQHYCLFPRRYILDQVTYAPRHSRCSIEMFYLRNIGNEHTEYSEPFFSGLESFTPFSFFHPLWSMGANPLGVSAGLGSAA